MHNLYNINFLFKKKLKETEMIIEIERYID